MYGSADGAEAAEVRGTHLLDVSDDPFHVERPAQGSPATVEAGPQFSTCSRVATARPASRGAEGQPGAHQYR
jgi:hypothetical protein